MAHGEPTSPSAGAARDFILRNTRLQRPPLVPEVQLYLADEIMRIWRALDDELGGRGIPPPFWAFAWAGGQAVARSLLDGGEGIAGKRVLDLGTGSGLCAIAALQAGAVSVLAVDIDPMCEEAVALNAEANGVAVEFARRDLLGAYVPVVDVILAGDIWYERPLADRALPWLLAAHGAGIRVLLGDPGRAYVPRERLTPLAAYDIPTTRDLEGMDLKHTTVYTFSP